MFQWVLFIFASVWLSTIIFQRFRRSPGARASHGQRNGIQSFPPAAAANGEITSILNSGSRPHYLGMHL